MSAVLAFPITTTAASLSPAGRLSTCLAALVFTLGALLPPPAGASALLDRVKTNEALARSLCDQFKQVNASGQSVWAKSTVEQVAKSQNLSMMDAEVLISYVIGLHCMDVR
jgi:hypothetical protein